MAFLNKYNKSEVYKYSSIVKSGNAYYAVGSIGDQNKDGLVLKISKKGKILWENAYRIDSVQNLEFKEAIICDNGDIIVFSEIQNRCIIFRINPAGTTIWRTEYFPSDSDEIVSVDVVKFETGLLTDNAENFIIHLKQATTGKGHIIKINGDGTIIFQRRINTIFNIGGITKILTNNESICLSHYGNFLIFDINLNLINHFRVAADSITPGVYNGFTPQYFNLYDNETLLIFGDLREISGPGINIFFKVNLSNPTGTFAGYKTFVNSIEEKYFINKENIIFFTAFANVYKFDLDLGEVLWVKNFVSDVHFTELTEQEVLIYSGDSIIGDLNLDFESCLTQELTGTELTPITGNCAVIGNVHMEEGTISAINYITSIAPIASEIEEICVFPGNEIIKVDIDDNSMLQSPNFYLQGAGSTGEDSTQGIHLRWTLKNGLANHLPKADYATPGINFNKANDYVKIYRAPYYPSKVTLDLTATPGIINDEKYFWVYAVGQRTFYVNFLNTQVYDEIRSAADPAQGAEYFLSTYMDNQGVLEIENKNHLSFAVTLYFQSAVPDSVPIKVELLSVEENKITAPRSATLRKTYGYSSLHGKKLMSENIRSIRLRSETLYTTKIEFEFYADFINEVNNGDGWFVLGQHALTLDDQLAYERLEPQSGMVNGTWLRYNDDAYVNIDNYKNRWDGQNIEAEERIKDCVQKYISLSNDQANPMATEFFEYPLTEGQPEEEANGFEISNLQLLNIAALDYHIARMLGLGVLDTNEEILEGQYIYVAEYFTYGDLQDGLGAREVHHIYCSLPTSVEDSRLPVPITLNKPEPGIFLNNMVESQDSITDADGYSHDGKARFISLFHLDLPDEQADMPFFYKYDEFISETSTIPVYAGIEYKKTEDALWRKPELSFNSRYNNIDGTVTDDYQKKETLSIMIPEPGYALYVHREKQSGSHDYSSYGINWFSRAASSPVIHRVVTLLKPTNNLLPPTNVNVVFVQKENPLFLTSASEQQMLKQLVDANANDKTLIRLTFDYDFAQEQIDYHKEIDGQIINGYSELPDAEELFADDIEIFFRNTVPSIVSGKIVSVSDDPTYPQIAIVETGPYELVSTGQDEPYLPNQWITPSLTTGAESSYIGSVIVIDDNEYTIISVGGSTYPVYKILKRSSDAMLTDINASIPDQLISPQPGGMFVAVENMQNDSSWNLYGTNPSSFKITIDHTVVYNENIASINIDNITETHVTKFRGIYEDAVISKVYEDVEVYEDENDEPVVQSRHLGLYKIEFPQFSMVQHSQNLPEPNIVEFYNGSVRIHTVTHPNGKRKILKVVKTANIGAAGQPLIIYANDATFPVNENELIDYDGKIVAEGQDSAFQKVNYYPGYKVYLYENVSQGMTEPNILPVEDEDLRYSIFSLRSHDTMYDFRSRLSTPALMYAKSIKEPLIPEKPEGGLFATRPDFFGKATYTFTTKFKHKPYSVQFGRASDIQVLSSLYDHSNNYQESRLSTVEYILEKIFKDGQEEFYMDRWGNLLGFNYPGGNFNEYPAQSGIVLPMPDSPNFIKAVNGFIKDHNIHYPGENVEEITAVTSLNQSVIVGNNEHGELLISDFIKETIYNCFVPLTEIPVLFDYIKGNDYTPIPKKQVVRDRNGNLLSSDAADFDMAPMMKICETDPEVITQFTDFGLDGASKAKYFYAAKEISLQMQTSAYSEILGPIAMVNTSPPVSPDIVKVISVLENRTLNIDPSIQFNINSYPSVQDIRKINLYRTTDRSASLSVRTMDLVKVIDLESENMLDLNIWTFKDSFSDLAFVPYGDLLYYRITVSRRIKYNNSEEQLIIDYAPSEASKLIVTNIANNYLPDSPFPSYTSEPYDGESLKSVVLQWEQTVYNGKYHIYKVSPQGNWIKIHEIATNDAIIDLQVDNLVMVNGDGNYINHHFKVLAENFSGMISTKENILTIYINAEGIGAMIIEDTFIVADEQ